MITPYTKHKAKWKNCKLCDLCTQRRQVVLGKGSLPADILFIGESPGQSDDVLGKPFSGLSGQLLDRIIEKAEIDHYRLFFTNLVACHPRMQVTPSKTEIESCNTRLLELINITKPSVIVAVGMVAAKVLEKLERPKKTYLGAIPHPSLILRMDNSQREMNIAVATANLCDIILAWEEGYNEN